MDSQWITDRRAAVLVTGAGGFVGSRVVEVLLRLGFQQVRAMVRPDGDRALLNAALPNGADDPRCRIIEGNLLSPLDCAKAVEGAALVLHLVAGRGKSFPACFQGSVITTRNLLDAVVRQGTVRRFVNVSSLIVYSNYGLKRGAIWDESCPLETDPAFRNDAYLYGKLKQDDLVCFYHRQHGIPYTVIRPGIVFGPGKKAIPGFVGMDTFGVFLHLGGGYPLPLTYVDNCAEAIVLAGLVPGVEGEAFNVVDDDPPSSRAFLRQYKRQVRRFWSIPVPFWAAFRLCHLWERYAIFSRDQLPPVFNRKKCVFAWKGHRYSNQKLKDRLGWSCRVPMKEALARYFSYQKHG